jgi:hypothetical protein
MAGVTAAPQPVQAAQVMIDDPVRLGNLPQGLA